MASNDEIRMVDYIIAYVDILGSTDILLSGDDEKISNFVYNLKELYSQYVDNEDIGMKIFSDNILLFADYDLGHTNKIIEVSASFQFDCAVRYNLLLRGSIVRGRLYRDENFVIGEGLVNAYKNESMATNPWILIDQSAGYVGELSCSSDDGHSHIDYLELSVTEDMFPDETVIVQHRDTLIKKVREYNELHRLKEHNESILAKIVWVIDYHNRFCHKYQLSYTINYKKEKSNDGTTMLVAEA